MLLNPYRFPVPAPAGPPVTAGLAMWLDASDNATIGITSGRVSSWSCKVTTTPYSQGNASYQPVLAEPGAMALQSIDFGESALRILHSTTGLTIAPPTTTFMAMRWGNRNSTYSSLALYNGASTPGSPIQTGSGVPYILVFTSTNSYGVLQLAPTAATYTYGPSAGIAKGSRGIAEFVSAASNATSELLIDGTPVTGVWGGPDAWPASLTFKAIGSGDNLYQSNGQIGEILMYSGVMGSTDRALVRAYLKAKWGTP